MTPVDPPTVPYVCCSHCAARFAVWRGGEFSFDFDFCPVCGAEIDDEDDDDD